MVNVKELEDEKFLLQIQYEFSGILVIAIPSLRLPRFRHCERSAAIHARACSTMDRHASLAMTSRGYGLAMTSRAYGLAMDESPQMKNAVAAFAGAPPRHGLGANG